MDSDNPFTRDPDKLDAVAKAFLKMKQVREQPKKTEEVPAKSEEK